MNQTWAAIKSKIQSVKAKKNPVIAVQPLNSTINDVEPEHLRIYKTIWSLLHLLGSIVGISAYKEMEFNLVFVITATMIFLTYPFLFYTMVVVWPDVSTLLEVICIFGVLTPVRFN